MDVRLIKRLSLVVCVIILVTFSSFVIANWGEIGDEPGGPGGASTPFPPSTITVPSSSTTGSFTVSWSSSGGAKYYTWREETNGSWSSTWNTVYGTSVALADRASGTYRYQVRACNNLATPTCSNIKTSGSITVSLTVKPSAVSGVSVSTTTSTDGNFSLSWNAATNAPTRYEYQESINGSWSGSWVSTGMSRALSKSGYGDGVYRYQIRACNSAGCGTGVNSSNITVSIPVASGPWSNTGGSVSDAIWTGDTPEPTTSDVVGALEGSGGVSGGAATYSIPIVIPPGRAGMQPSVSLSYSSRSGNGIAGVGWGLSAGSSIHRCSATAAQDKYGHGVTYSSNDKLCFDGQRLMLVSGTYGQSGATYQTENDSFAKVVQSGSITSSYSSFVVYHKNGHIAHYGESSNSRHVASGVTLPLSWKIARKYDRSPKKNAIHYNYTVGSEGEHLLSSIAYTGSGTLQGDRQTQFIYETRPDINRSYMAGGVTRSSKRLKTIQTKYQSQIIREYKLTYNTSGFTNRSILKEIQECASGKCLPATKATSYDPVYSWSDTDSSSAANRVLAELGVMVEDGDIVKRYDLNGDGVLELIYMRLGILDVDDSAARTKIYQRNAQGEYEPKSTVSTVPSNFGDVNLDGIPDMLYIDSSQNKLGYIQFDEALQPTYVLTNFSTANMSSVISSFYNVQHIDVTNDGYQDLVFRDYSNNSIKYFPRTAGNAIAFGQEATFMQMRRRSQGSNYIREEASYWDVDGDGVVDAIKSYRNNTSSLEVNVSFGKINSGLWQLDQNRSSSQMGLPSNHFYNQYFFADLNGDGLKDFVRTIKSNNSYDWRVQINLGNRQFAAERSLNTGIGIHEHKMRLEGDSYTYKVQSKWGGATFADFDNDGKEELFTPTVSNDNLCAKFIGMPVNGPTGEYYEVDVCNDDLHREDKVSMTQQSNLTVHINFSRYDFRRFKWSIVDFKELSAGLTADTVTPNVVNAPIQGFNTLNVDNRWEPLALKDINNDGLLDFSYRTVTSYSFDHCSPPPQGMTNYNCRMSVGGADYYNVAFNVQFESDTPAIAAGYYEQLNLIGENSDSGKLADTAHSIENGLGVGNTWSYAPLSRHIIRAGNAKGFYDVPEGPENRYVATDAKRHNFMFTSSMYVVSKSSESNGIGGDNTKQYSYREAVYNRMGRGFQGFRTIVIDDISDSNTQNRIRTVSDFHQIYPLAGKLEQTRSCLISQSVSGDCRDGANLSVTDYSWGLERSYSNYAFTSVKGGITSTEDDFTNEVYDGVGQNIRYLVTPESQITTHYQTASGHNSALQSLGTPLYTTEVTTDFDLYGNLTFKETLYSESAGGQSVSNTQNYGYTNNTSNWWFRLDNSTVTSDPVSGASSATDFQKVVTTSYSYNATNRKPTLVTVTPTQGGGCSSSVSTAYDDYGQPTSITSNGKDENCNTVAARTVSTSYTSDGYFVASITNAKGHATATTVDPTHGQVTHTIDPNQQTTTITYDPFGRVRSTRLNNGPTQWATYYWCLGVNGGSAWCTTYGKYRIRTDQKGSPLTYTYFDQMNREIDRLDAQFDGINWYRTYRRYNNLGSLAYETNRYDNTNVTESRKFTYYDSYDALGRLTKKRTPQSESANSYMTTTYRYDGFDTEVNAVSTAGSLAMSRTYNGLGQLMETEDALGGITSYTYDGTGNPIVMQDAAGNQITAKYNALGHKEWVDDPNMGKKHFWYNTFGEVEKETDANGDTLTYVYDVLGRMTSRYVNDNVNGFWVYDDTSKGLGLLSYEKNGEEDDYYNKLQKEYFYSPNESSCGKNLIQVKHSFYGTSSSDYSDEDTYHYTDDNYCRPKGMKYGSSGLTLAYDYNDRGYMTRIKNANSGYVYQEITGMDALGNITQQAQADGLLSQEALYHPATGQMKKIVSKRGSNNNYTHELHSIVYNYNGFSNLSKRTLTTPAANGVFNKLQVENYDYDELHRLILSERDFNPWLTIAYDYDAIGNFIYKTDFSNAYIHGDEDKSNSANAGPNAVRSAILAGGGTASYQYDNNGNMTRSSISGVSRDGKTIGGNSIVYNAFNKPVEIVNLSTSVRSDFSYGADIMRYKQVQSGLAGGKTETTYYVDKLLEKVETRTNNNQSLSKTVYRHYIGDMAIQTQTVTANNGSNSSWDLSFLQRDRLGSVVTVLNDNGDVIERRDYDPFGKPRKGDSSDKHPEVPFGAGIILNLIDDGYLGGSNQPSEPVTDRGFTDHEHLDDFELIHMNGRAYDYNLGRFLSVDPFVQAPGNSQSMNPYSYIMNNPLAGTDPTGYSANCDGTVMECGTDEPKKPETPNPEKENGNNKPKLSEKELEQLLSEALKGERVVQIKDKGTTITISKNKIENKDDKTGKVNVSVSVTGGTTLNSAIKRYKTQTKREALKIAYKSMKIKGVNIREMSNDELEHQLGVVNSMINFRHSNRSNKRAALEGVESLKNIDRHLYKQLKEQMLFMLVNPEWTPWSLSADELRRYRRINYIVSRAIGLTVGGGFTARGLYANPKSVLRLSPFIVIGLSANKAYDEQTIELERMREDY